MNEELDAPGWCDLVADLHKNTNGTLRNTHKIEYEN